MLYEFASSAANNGSGFEGLADNTLFWNITTGLVMFFGRYLSIVLQLAIAGSLMKKRFVSESAGTLHTDTMGFADHELCRHFGVCRLHLCGADLLPGAGAWPCCRTFDPLGIRRNLP